MKVTKKSHIDFKSKHKDNPKPLKHGVQNFDIKGSPDIVAAALP